MGEPTRRKTRIVFPIRLKIMVAMLLALTAVVVAISVTMSSFFHEDKQSYMNDWTSIAVMSTAEEGRTLLRGYRQQLEACALVLLDEKLDAERKRRLLEGAFSRFPQLLALSLIRDGKELDSVVDEKTFAAAGKTAQDLRDDLARHVPSAESLRDGTTHVRNSTLTPGLPTVELAFVPEAAAGSAPLVLRGTVRLDELLRLGAKFKVFEITLADSDGVLIAHPDAGKVSRREPAAALPPAVAAGKGSQAGLTVEFDRGGTTMLGGFADVGFGGMRAAAVMPKSAAYLASRTLLGRLMGMTLLILLVVAVVGRLWSARITRPLETLSKATRTIAQGTFDVHVDVRSRDEIGALAGSFNQMADELDARQKALKEAQSQLVQSEKMAAFGQLGAGIAHEVKNPLAGILGCAQLSLLDAEAGTSIHENLSLIEKETRRCKTIIENLLRFARQEKVAKDPVCLNDVVNDAAAITNHQLELAEVKLEKDLAPSLPLVLASGNQVQQVLMNLFVNAQQAMKGKPGRIRVSTRAVEGDLVEVTVTDDGPGIPKQIQESIFEPFFTTKPAGEGTGLGLSVSFGIIKDHNGEIRVESEEGRGATFRIRIPAIRIPQPARKEEPVLVG